MASGFAPVGVAAGGEIAGDVTISGGDIDAGASGTAGSLDIFPSTAAKGKLSFVAADSAGNTTTTVTNASQAAARTYTIPDGGQLTGQFILNEGAYVFNESSADVDGRWESNALANFMYLDASECLNGTLSIGAVAPTNPQCIFAVVPPANATGVTANQSYFHVQVLPGGAVVVPTGTAPVVASLNVHEPNITATGTVTTACTVRIVDAPTEGTNNHALLVNAGSTRLDGDLLQGGNAGDAASTRRVIIAPKACADNTATDLVTVTVPNANHSAAIRVTLLGRSAGTDAYESSRVAEGMVVLARTAGANAVAAAATLELAQIATVSGGDTFTLAYGVSSIAGAAGATNTFTIQVTLNSVGNQALSCMAVVEIINEAATGVTLAAA